MGRRSPGGGRSDRWRLPCRSTRSRRPGGNRRRWYTRPGRRCHRRAGQVPRSGRRRHCGSTIVADSAAQLGALAARVFERIAEADRVLVAVTEGRARRAVDRTGVPGHAHHALHRGVGVAVAADHAARAHARIDAAASHTGAKAAAEVDAHVGCDEINVSVVGVPQLGAPRRRQSRAAASQRPMLPQGQMTPP